MTGFSMKIFAVLAVGLGVAAAQPALASTPVDGFVGTYQVVASSKPACDLPGCFFHVHIGDQLKIEASGNEARIVADGTGLSTLLKTEDQETGEGYFKKSGFYSENGTVAWYTSNGVSGTTVKFISVGNALQLAFQTDNNGYVVSEIAVTLQKLPVQN